MARHSNKNPDEELLPLDKLVAEDKVKGTVTNGHDLGHTGENNGPNSYPSSNCDGFEDILNVIGDQGKYQKIFLYAIMTPIGIISPFIFMNMLFMWDIPDHWCHVPGWDPQKWTLEEWKNRTLPWEKGPDGQMRHSQCRMIDQTTGNETKCQYGWEYDQTDYSSTVPSEYDWVCDRDYYATDCYSWYMVGSAIGTVLFGILADKYGRKPVFFLACLTNLLPKVISLYFAHHYLIYKTLQLITGFSCPALFNMPGLINVEMSGTDYRSWIFAVQWMVWVIGNALIPLVAMVCRGWFLFGWVTAAPIFFLFLYYPFIDESPRWLITAGKTKQATKIILRMAKVNGSNVEPDKIKMMVEQIAQKQAKESENQSLGVWTLFSKFRIAKSTIMLITTWTMNMLTYDGLTLNTTRMAGNKFFNYFVLALIELPAGWVGGKMAELTGRRWTQAGFFLLCTLSFLACAIAAAYPDSALVVIIIALGIKFGLSITTMIVYLQGAEIFPTQLRSTGSGLASTVSSVVGVFGPYIVYSGTHHVSLPYFIFCICTCIGFTSAMFLPETMKQNLPETIEDANNFGRDHKFWSYLPQSRKAGAVVDDGSLQKINSR